MCVCVIVNNQEGFRLNFCRFINPLSSLRSIHQNIKNTQWAINETIAFWYYIANDNWHFNWIAVNLNFMAYKMFPKTFSLNPHYTLSIL